MADTDNKREKEIRSIWKEYRFFYQVTGGTILVGIGILIGAIWFSSEVDRSAYLINLYTSLLSIIVTIFVIDLLNRRRDDRNALRELQEQLVRDAGSAVNDVARNAVHQLRKRGWLEGNEGLLRGEDLYRANLKQADLSKINLNAVNLRGAKLQKANIHSANLQSANLYMTDLKEANLDHANLQNANLMGASLEQAYLRYSILREANLKGVQLHKADLSFANLDKAVIGAWLPSRPWIHTRLDESTILPDGTNWTPDTDMTKFGCIVSDE